MKPRSRNVILLIICLFCLGILLINFIPNLWFQRHLSKNWNIPESGMDLAEFSRLPNRLCLIFSVFRQDQSVIVQGATGYGRISRRDNYYRYEAIQGDPLLLASIQDRLQQAYPASVGGYFHATGWWRATQNHIYPDPLHRIWEGLHDLVQHPATLLISLKDCGPLIKENIWKNISRLPYSKMPPKPSWWNQF